MDSTSILEILNNLVKPRDFLLAALPSVGIFIVESYDEFFIPFLESGHSAICTLILGISFSKILYFSWDRRVLKRKSKKLIKQLEIKSSDENMSRIEKREIQKLSSIMKSALENFEERIIDQDKMKLFIDSTVDQSIEILSN